MFPQLGFPEMLVVMVVAVLLFGKRLPEVGRSLGKGIIEFKKGLRGVEEEFEGTGTTNYPAPRTETRSTYETSDAEVPKFELPSTPPTLVTETEPRTASD